MKVKITLRVEGTVWLTLVPEGIKKQSLEKLVRVVEFRLNFVTIVGKKAKDKMT